MVNTDNSMLLHVCCGPCASGVIPALHESETNFEAFFYNPNIEPESEYYKRLRTFNNYAAQVGITVHEGAYDPDAWHKAIGDAGGVFPLIKGDANYDRDRSLRLSRCRRCYAHRFDQLGKTAAELGFESISTTLSISLYQFTDFIDVSLEEAAQKWQLRSAFVDYTSRYRESIMASRDLGMYRQKYCGCMYSKQEAEIEQQARKAARGR